MLVDASLFLDFDGTLVPIAPHPNAVIVGDDLRMLLLRLSGALSGRLTIISGRSVRALLTLLGDPPYPIIGSHGAESRSAADGYRSAAAPLGLAEIIVDLRCFGRGVPGVVVEAKPHGAALHYRQAPHAREACRAIAAGLAARDGYALLEGKMVFEVRGAGADKERALAAAMARPDWAGTRPIMIGDDLTDEPAFAAAAKLGGAGILVGPDAPTAARYRLAGTDEALAWLSAGCAALAVADF